MAMKEQSFKAIISSDWNQCLAPCGPFDPITYSYADLTLDLTTIFEESTWVGVSTASSSNTTCGIHVMAGEIISILPKGQLLKNSIKLAI
jgi:hypothetical protein